MRKLTLSFSILLSVLFVRAQSSSIVSANISRLFGGIPLDSSYSAIAAWCRENGFSPTLNHNGPRMQEFHRTTAGDGRFDDQPDSVVTYLSLPLDSKAAAATHVASNIVLQLIYKNDGSGKAKKEYKALSKLLEKWTGNVSVASLQDWQHLNKKWEGVSFWAKGVGQFPMLRLDYLISRKRPDQEVVTIGYSRLTDEP